MDTKKQESPFQFMGSRVLELHINNSYVNFDPSSDDSKSVDISHQISDVIEYEHSLLGSVQLDINVSISNSTDEENPSKKELILNVKIEGGFSATEEMPIDEFEKMLHINGVAALYSIARGLIISITSQTLTSGQVVLPLLNFTK